MKGKDFLSVADLPPEGVAQLVERAYTMKRGKGERPLEGKEFALLFEKPSLRTRVSFEVGIRQLAEPVPISASRMSDLACASLKRTSRVCSTAGWTA